MAESLWRSQQRINRSRLARRYLRLADKYRHRPTIARRYRAKAWAIYWELGRSRFYDQADITNSPGLVRFDTTQISIVAHIWGSQTNEKTLAWIYGKTNEETFHGQPPKSLRVVCLELDCTRFPSVKRLTITIERKLEFVFGDVVGGHQNFRPVWRHRPLYGDEELVIEADSPHETEDFELILSYCKNIESTCAARMRKAISNGGIN